MYCRPDSKYFILGGHGVVEPFPRSKYQLGTHMDPTAMMRKPLEGICVYYMHICSYMDSLGLWNWLPSTLYKVHGFSAPCLNNEPLGTIGIRAHRPRIRTDNDGSSWRLLGCHGSLQVDLQPCLIPGDQDEVSQ